MLVLEVKMKRKELMWTCLLRSEIDVEEFAYFFRACTFYYVGNSLAPKVTAAFDPSTTMAEKEVAPTEAI